MRYKRFIINKIIGKGGRKSTDALKLPRTMERATFEDLDFTAIADEVIDHDKEEIHFNGFSVNDMY